MIKGLQKRKVESRFLVAGISKIPNVSIIKPSDSCLYEQFFKIDRPYKACYSNGWAYVTQVARGIGQGLGLKYYTKDCLITIGVHSEHVVISRPLGDYEKYLPDLLGTLGSISGKPIYIKKLIGEKAEYLAKIIPLSLARLDYPWDPKYSEDDDTYPEIIVDINRTLSFGDLPTRRLKNIRWSVQRFSKLGLNIEIKKYKAANMWGPVWDYLTKHFGRDHLEDEMFAKAYENMLIYLPNGSNGEKYFSFVAFIHDEIVGYFFAEKVDDESAALYASIGCAEKTAQNMPKYIGLTEYLYVEMMKRLQKNGIKYLNLGGSEVVTLHTFKRKFWPVKEVKLPIFVYGIAKQR